MPVGSANGSSPRTSMVMSEMPPTTPTPPSLSTVTLNLSEPQKAALSGSTGSRAKDNITVATGNGNATRPSFREAALSFMKDKFEAFCGKLEGFKASVKEGLGEAKTYISAKIDALITGGPPLPTQARTPLPMEPVDMTTSATKHQLGTVYNAITREGKKIDDTNHTTFLRGDTVLKDKEGKVVEESHRKYIVETSAGAMQNLVKTIFNDLPESGVVAVGKEHYNGSGANFKSDDGTPFINARTEARVAQASADFVVRTIERVFGHDASSAQAAANLLPQATKDLMATGVLATRMSVQEKYQDAAAERFLVDVLLRAMSPVISTFGLPNSGRPDFVPPKVTSDESVSLKEVAKVIQGLANKGTMADSPTNIHFLAALAPHETRLAANIKSMLQTAAAQGTAYLPSNTGSTATGTA